MSIIHKRQLLMMLLLLGLTLAGSDPRSLPVLAQIEETVSFTFEKIQVRNQSIEVRGAAGSLLGSGKFRANVSSNRNGRTNGKAELQLPDFTLEIEFTGVDEILYEDDQPVGVVLRGRGTLLREGQTETFPATATVREGATTTIPDCLIWDIPGPPVLDGLSFDAEGALRFREDKS